MGEQGPAQPVTLLEHLIRAREATYGELAAEFVSHAAQLREGASMSARHLRRMAHGEVQSPTPATSRVLRAMFGRPVGELLGPYVASGSRSGRSEVDGRNEKGVLAMATERSRAFSLQARDNVTDEGIEQIFEDVRHLVQSYPQQPVTEVISMLVETQDVVFGLTELPQRPRHGRDLYLLAGVTTGLLAKVCHDRGDAHGAMTHARAAFVCAEQLDHPGLQAWVRGLQSMIAYWSHRPQEAVRFAQLGAEPAGRRNSSMAAWLPVSEARGWALLGRTDQAVACIQRADEARQSLESDDLDQLGGLCWFGPARQAYYAADALAWLPDQATKTEQYATAAINAYAEGGLEYSWSDEAGARTDLAIAHIGRDELDGAEEQLQPVLGLPPEQRIHGVVASAARVADTLRRSRYATSSSGMQDQIEAFTRTTLREIAR